MALIDLAAPNWNDLYSLVSGGGGATALPSSVPMISTTSAPSSGGSIFNSIFNNQTATGLPRTAEQAGALALLGYSMRPQEDVTAPSIFDLRGPYGTSAVNYLQGLYQAPANPFAEGGIASQYLPWYNQQEQQLLNDVGTRYAAMSPEGLSPAAQGAEFAGLRSSLADYIIPQRQAFFADLMRENLARQQNAANTVYAGEGNFAQSEYEGQLKAAIANASTETERNKYLAALGTALLLSGRGGAAGATGGAAGMPGTGTAAGTGQGGVGDAIRRALGGSGVQPGSPYAPIGQMSIQDIFGQMQAGTLSTAEGLALIARTQGLPLIGTAAAGYGAGQLASMVGQNQFQSSAGGALGGAATGALLGSTILPGVGTAIGAVVGGIGGLLGGLFGERTDQAQIKEAFRQQDLDSQADQVQEIGSFFTQRLGGLGVDTSGFQQFISQMISGSEAGAGSYSFGGISGTADQQQAVADVGGKILLQALQQANPSITSLNQVPGLREEFIDYLTRSTFSAENGSYGGGAPLNQFQPWWEAGLARGGYLPAGGEFLVGERGPELLRAAPGSSVLPMNRMADGSFAFNPQAGQRPVFPTMPQLPFQAQATLPQITMPSLARGSPFIPNVNQPFERPGFNMPNPGQALVANFSPAAMTPQAIPVLLEALRASGTFAPPNPYSTGQPPVRRRRRFDAPTYA